MTIGVRSLVSVVGGRAGLVAFWFVGNLLIMRTLGPSEYGVYALAITSIKVLAGVLGDPFDLSVLRVVPVHLSVNRPRALEILHTVFWVRGAVGLAVLGLAALLAQLLAEHVFHARDRAGVVVLTAVGVLGELFMRWVSGYYQAAERFGRYMVLEATLHIGRFVVVLMLLAGGALSATVALGVYAAAPYAVFAVGALLLPADVRRLGPPTPRDVWAVAQYVSWMVLGLGLAAIFDRVDVLLLGAFAGPAAVGVYSAALALATLPDFVASSLGTVLNPRIVPVYLSGQFAGLMRRYLSYAVPAGVAALMVALGFGGFVIETFLSEKYMTAIPLFRALVVGTVFWAVVTPLPAGLVALLAPRRVATLSGVGLGASLVGGLLLIPPFGATGAAILFVAVRVVQGAVIVELARRILRERPPVGDAVVPEAAVVGQGARP